MLRLFTVKVAENLRGGRRLNHIRQQFKEALAGFPVEGAAMEGPSLESTHREFDLGSVFGVIQEVVYSIWSVEPLIITPSTLKLFAANNGNASKADVIDAVNKLHKLTITDDNQADALALATFARMYADPARALTRGHAEGLKSYRTSLTRTSKSRRKKTPNV